HALQGNDLILPIVLGDDVDLHVFNIRPVLQRVRGEPKNGRVVWACGYPPPRAPAVGIREAGARLAFAVHEPLPAPPARRPGPRPGPSARRPPSVCPGPVSSR